MSLHYLEKYNMVPFDPPWTVWLVLNPTPYKQYKPVTYLHLRFAVFLKLMPEVEHDKTVDPASRHTTCSTYDTQPHHNNNHNNVSVAIIMTKVIARVNPVQIIIHDQRHHHHHQHHHGRVAGKGHRIIAPPCPRSTARIQRSPTRRVESFRS